MSQPGYHPTCVLFQGNDCAFDGTYRLVCRHQIRPRDFQPGDNVEVDMGYDDDDDDVIEQRGDGTNEDGARWRDAIALGDKMVMSLLRNMCKNQPAGRTPWGSNNKQSKRKEVTDEIDALRTKRIKTEERTTSQETVDRVEDRPSQNDHLMQSILSAIHSVQAAQNLVTSELHIIRQDQQLLGEQVTAIRKTLSRLEHTRKTCDTTGHDSEPETTPTPMSLFLSPSAQALGSHITSSGPTAHSPGIQATTSMASTTSASDYPEIIILDPRSQSEPDLSSFPTQDPQDESLSALPALYPIGDTPDSYPEVPYDHHFTDGTKTKVYLGYKQSPVILSKHQLDDILAKTNNPPAFAYRLAGKIFTNEELFNGNTTGKGQMRCGTPFKPLNRKVLDVILLEVEARFPTFLDSQQNTKKLHAAISERCRNERKKAIYQYSKPNTVTI